MNWAFDFIIVVAVIAGVVWGTLFIAEQIAPAIANATIGVFEVVPR